jgi:hypothetical protein
MPLDKLDAAFLVALAAVALLAMVGGVLSA